MSMIPIAGLFETHVSVADLGRSIAFYGDKLHLAIARVFPERKVAFFWIVAPGTAMLGVWEAGTMPMGLRVHFAFRVSLRDLHDSVIQLRTAEIVPRDFDGNPTDEPVVLAWMPAASVFFRDPDDNLLEYITMLPGTQRRRPELGVIRWSEWERAAK